MDSNQVYNILCEKRKVSIRCSSKQEYWKIRNSLYKKQSLLNSIAGKTDTLCSQFDAVAGIAAFNLTNAPPPTEYEILE